jgi:hypothetical protein
VFLIVHFANLWRLFTPHAKVQKALRWWNFRQSTRLDRQAEKIRDELLQELFTLRRSLELVPMDNVGLLGDHYQEWLNKIEKVHYSLEDLSHFLSPPYMEESLPLAIQYRLKQWQQKNSMVNVQMELHSPKYRGSPDQNRVILMVMDELLQLVVPKDLLKEPLSIRLNSRGGKSELQLQITYPHEAMLMSLQRTKELNYLRQVFRLLTGGRCFWQKQGLVVIWCCQWRSQV